MPTRFSDEPSKPVGGGLAAWKLSQIDPFDLPSDLHGTPVKLAGKSISGCKGDPSTRDKDTNIVLMTICEGVSAGPYFARELVLYIEGTTGIRLHICYMR